MKKKLKKFSQHVGNNKTLHKSPPTSKNLAKPIKTNRNVIPKQHKTFPNLFGLSFNDIQKILLDAIKTPKSTEKAPE